MNIKDLLSSTGYKRGDNEKSRYGDNKQRTKWLGEDVHG